MFRLLILSRYLDVDAQPVSSVEILFGSFPENVALNVVLLSINAHFWYVGTLHHTYKDLYG